MFRYESNAERTAIIRFRHESASGQLHIFDDGTARVTQIFSRVRGSGHAKALLEEMVAYADERGMYLYLEVQRYGYSDKKALTNAQLIDFYQKFGFVITRWKRSDTEMERFARITTPIVTPH